MLALANLSMEARSNGFFEKMDVKKDEKASHWEIKLLSPNHKEKQIPTRGQEQGSRAPFECTVTLLIIKPQGLRVRMHFIRSVP